MPAGRYFLTRLVASLPENSGVENLELEASTIQCDSTSWFAPQVECVLSAGVTFLRNGKRRTVDMRDRQNVGAQYIDGVGLNAIHGQLIQLIDTAVAQHPLIPN